jgi:hypothetical protein
MHLLVLVVLYHHAVKKMVLQPTTQPVNVDQQNVLLIPDIAIHPVVFVVLCHRAVKKMDLQPTTKSVDAELQNVL